MTLRFLQGLCFLFALTLVACAPSDGSTEEKRTPQSEGRLSGLLPVEIDKSDPEELLRYHLGAYAAPEGADPFRAGLLVEQEGGFAIDTDVLADRHSGAADVLRDVSADGVLNWKELEAFLQATYYDVRALPPTLADLQKEAPYLGNEEPWFRVELDGVMTTARRHVYVPEGALRSALASYHANGERLIYPVGTTMVGEHHAGGERVETTAMRKRADGFWDFFTYDAEGNLAKSTNTPPRKLKTPTQCVGCHTGNKPFEPERSFPGEALPGPHGPRALYVDAALGDAEVVAFFDEHRKRSDTVLGIYNTLFVARLRADRRAGRLGEADVRLLEGLGL